MHKPRKTNSNNKGFTLVELLVVISLVGILASVTVALINPVKQRRVAMDGVKMSNLQKLAQAIEAYFQYNGRYPSAKEMEDADKDLVPDDPEVANFVKKIPNDEPEKGVVYYFNSNFPNLDQFIVYVTRSDTDANECFKYSSSWGKIKNCPEKFCEIGSFDGECTDL